MAEERVSVAIATYNGGKYLEEQLMSILHQTQQVNEIVISDDGSTDNTLVIAHKIAERPEAQNIRFVFLQDNPRKGSGGNFDWAISHCSGEYIFICGQDDVWIPSKVETVLEVFRAHTDALCVLHNARIIDEKGIETNKPFLQTYGERALLNYCGDKRITKLGGNLLEISVSNTLVCGIAITIKNTIAKELSPIPQFAEDQWIAFVSIAFDGCYFLNEELAYYRKHAENTSGKRASGFERVLRIITFMKNINKRRTSYLYGVEYPTFCLRKLELLGFQESAAYEVASKINEIGKVKNRAFEQGGIKGALILFHMYRHNLRYKKSGFWPFFFDALFIMSIKV